MTTLIIVMHYKSRIYFYWFAGINYTSNIGTTTPPSQTGDSGGSTTPDNSVGGLMASGGENAMDSTVSSPVELYPQQTTQQPSTLPLIQQHQQQQQQQQQHQQQLQLQQQQNRYQHQRNYHHQQQHRGANG